MVGITAVANTADDDGLLGDGVLIPPPLPAILIPPVGTSASTIEESQLIPLLISTTIKKLIELAVEPEKVENEFRF